MYVFIAKSKVDIADIEIFEADQRERSRSLLKAPGFIQRLVLRDNENPGIYFYVSAWKSKAEHQGFKADPDVKAWERSLKARNAHFVELERIMEQVSQALTPRGLFVLEEFVGPTRFQWTDLQLEAVRLLLAMLPAGLRLFHPNLMSTMDEGRTEELASRLPFSIFPTPVAKATIRGLRRLRRSVNGRALERIKTAEGRPSPAEVIALSPFESIRSSEIAPLFRERFELVESRLLGGTIQHLLYNGVMHNFRAAADLGAQWITAVQRVEDAFIDSALLPSDFQLLVGRRRR
jgi:heme-degrading monooxygenase HmoA